MTKGYFITGTDTAVGKTFIASLMARALRHRGVDIGVMKPVETGCMRESDMLRPSDAISLKEAARCKDDIDQINPYRFAPPLSPHLAASLVPTWIDAEKIKKYYGELAEKHDVMIVEGAGGLLAPLSLHMTMADLARELQLPLVIVAASRLGVFNHTLLTVRNALSSGLSIKGIILNNTDQETDESRDHNALEIKKLLPHVSFLGEVPFLEREAGFKRAEETMAEAFEE